MSSESNQPLPLRLVGTVVTAFAATVIGFGVPLGWIWIGSQVQGDGGAASTSFSAAVVVLFGIIFSYIALGWIAGWAQARSDAEQPRRGPPASARYPWMQSQADTRGLPGAGTRLRPLERVFVTTTLIVSVTFWVWFMFFAEGGGLPHP